MKKNVAKLALQRETIRTLSKAKLHYVAGGDDVVNLMDTGGPCGTGVVVQVIIPVTSAVATECGG